MRSPIQTRVERRLFVALVGLLAILARGGDARADVLDLQMQKLLRADECKTPFANLACDKMAQQDYRMLMSELGVAISPKMLTTADTIGYSGFQFTFDAAFTSISNTQNAWLYGTQGRKDDGTGGVPSHVTSLSVHARKGIWLPLPSFEIGAGATKLLQSDIYAVDAYAKFALHEGFHGWPVPSLAARGSVLRVLGTNQVDLTLAQVDASISKVFGIAGTLSITPYLGYAALFIIARGQVLDTTPQRDALQEGPQSLDLNNNAVFPNQDTIIRHRFFGGIRLHYAILVLTADVTVSTCGDLGSSCDHAKVEATGKIPDRSKTQLTYAVSGGFLF